ncbi:flagellar motor protein MotB [Candidatus Auribacterota bacterium]
MSNNSILKNISTSQDQQTPLWLVTFADSMSLLLAFFVLLFSFNEVIVDKVIDYNPHTIVKSKRRYGIDIKKRSQDESLDEGGIGKEVEGMYKDSSGEMLEEETISDEDIKQSFYGIVKNLNQVADLQIEKKLGSFYIYFILKKIFEKETAILNHSGQKKLAQLAKVMGQLPNDIVVESYYIPSPERREIDIPLYIRRIEAVAEYLIREGDIISERIGVSESSTYFDLYSTYSDQEKEKYSGIRIVLINKTEGKKEFFKKVKEYDRREPSRK